MATLCAVCNELVNDADGKIHTSIDDGQEYDDWICDRCAIPQLENKMIDLSQYDEEIKQALLENPVIAEAEAKREEEEDQDAD